MPTSTTPCLLLTALERGNMQFASAFRAFSFQWTQTELLRLAELHLGVKALHSSQIGGFRTGKLQEPAPKVFLALGYLNIALAHSIGHPSELIEPDTALKYPSKLPGQVRGLWEGRIPMVDSDGVALGPVGMFEAFCGLRSLPAKAQRELSDEQVPEACKVLGGFLRTHYAKHDIDWYEQLKSLAYDCPTIEPLLLNKPVGRDRLLNDLDTIGSTIGLSGDALWQHIEAHLGK